MVVHVLRRLGNQEIGQPEEHMHEVVGIAPSCIRAVAEAPDGAIWLLEDGSGGRLLELRPA